MNIKNLNLKDFKRNIAIILLAGLLLSLFGSFSFLMGMETAIIKDVNGQEFTLNQAQKNSLGQCKTLKSMLLDCGNAQQIDFEGLAAPVLKDTVLQLAQCIENPKNIDQIPNNKIVDLFQLADYLHAPKEISIVLAEKVEKLIEPRIAALEELVDKKQSLNELQAAEYEDLKNLWQSLQKHFGIRMSEWLKNNEHRVPGKIDLSCKPEMKNSRKLRRLNGLDKINHRYSIVELDCNNHNISSVDIAYLRKTFPNLRRLSLKNNRIEKVVETTPIRGLKVNLEGNPLKSIMIENPERSNYLNFKTDSPQVKVIFLQNEFGAKITWFKSLWAKIKAARNFFLPPTQHLLWYAVIGIGLKLSSNVIDFISNPLVYDPEQLLVVSENLLFYVYDENDAQYTVEILKELGSNAAQIVKLKDVVNLLPSPPVQEIANKNFGCWFPSYTKAGLYSMLALAALAVGKQFVFNENITDFPNALNDYAQSNPYRIQMKAKDTAFARFPSNYTYNLFGKI